MAGQLERFRINQIDVCGRDGEDDAVGLCDVLCDEVARLLFNVGRLVANGYLVEGQPALARVERGTTHLCQTGQIDQSQTQDMG